MGTNTSTWTYSGSGAGLIAPLTINSSLNGASGSVVFSINNTATVGSCYCGLFSCTGSSTNNYGINANAYGASATNIGGVFQADTGGSSTYCYGIQVGARNGTNNSAIYILSGYPVAGANNWAIYSESQAQSYFAGNIGIGTSSPTTYQHGIGGLAIYGASCSGVALANDGASGKDWVLCSYNDDFRIYESAASHAAGTDRFIMKAGGGTILSCPTSSISSSLIFNSGFNPYLDEANNRLYFYVKRSDGVMKQGYVQLS
jgi:hypothetical protein